MAKYYSRKKLQEKKDRRKAFLFIVLTIAVIVTFVFYGLPVVVKYAAFLTDLRKTDQPIETQDSTPPPPPKIDDLPDSTNKTAIDIHGRTEPGATVILHLNSKEEQILANNEGEFTYTFELLDGENSFYAVAEDSSGNKSQKSETITFTYDDDPPELNINSPEDGASFYGSRQRQITIEGETETDSKVQINERLVVVDSSGIFEYTTSLTEGENKFAITAEDPAGNKTESELILNYSL